MASELPSPQFVYADAAIPKKHSITIEEGDFSPLYGFKPGEEIVHVSAFSLDSFPVTNGEYLAFIGLHPEWNKARASKLLVDDNYLSQLGTARARRDSPITSVSYFAAAAYCEWRGGRLPTTNEWEYVGAADETKRDASKDPEFVQKLLEWYAKPAGSEGLELVGRGRPNAWGVYDMHGLIWEWTQDFNSVFVSSDNRRESDQLKNLFCGVGSVNATDKANYAAFMRYALRSSLQGRYSMENLGFRCAYDRLENKANEVIR